MQKLKALAGEMAKFDHDLDAEAEAIMNGIAVHRAAAPVVFTKVRAKVASYGEHLNEIGTSMDELDRATNGPPSSASSGESAAPARNGPDINGVTVHKQG